MSRTLAVALLVLGQLAPLAFAQPGGASAQAEVLFRRGKQQMAAGQIAEACASFDASQKLDPTIATRMNQANCREKNGQLATAWGLFLEAERQTRTARDDAGRRLHLVAADRAAKLEPRLSSLRIVVSPDHQLDGLEVTRDGQRLDPALWNTKLPIDGGTYQLTARAPGRAEWTTTVTVAAERDARTVDVPLLAPSRAQVEPSPARPAPPPRPDRPLPSPPAGTPPTQPVDAPRPAPSRFTGRRKLALAVGGVAVAAVVVGGVFGSAAQADQADAEALCPDPAMPCADADQATELTRQGHDKALRANIGFGIGAAAAIGAAVLWFTGAPHESRRIAVTPRVTSGGVGVAIEGGF